MPMHLRYGSLVSSPLRTPVYDIEYRRRHVQANPNALIFLMVEGKAEKPWTRREQICSTFFGEASLHGILNAARWVKNCTLLKWIFCVVSVWRKLIDSQHLKQRKDLPAVTTVTSQVKFLLRQQAGKSQTRMQMKPIKGCRHTNDTNLIFWRLRILKPVPLGSRRE